MNYDKQKINKGANYRYARKHGLDEAFVEYLRVEYEFAKQANTAFKKGEINPPVPPRNIEGLFTPEQNEELVRLWKRIPPEFLITRQRRFFRREA